MRKDASAAMKATIRTSDRDMGAELRVLLTALLFLAATDVRCSITADAQASGPTPLPEVENVPSFQQFEGTNPFVTVLEIYCCGLAAFTGLFSCDHMCSEAHRR